MAPLLLLLVASTSGRDHYLVQQGASLSDSLWSTHGKVPLVEGFGYTNYFKFLNIQDFGIMLKLQMDLYTGYQTNLFTMKPSANSALNNLVFNPHWFLEAAWHSAIQFDFVFFKYELKFDFSGYRYTPVDLSVVWTIEKPMQVCYGMQWWTQTLHSEINTALEVNEC